MNARRNAWLVNGALALCAALVLFPLFWGLSVWFMPPGDADNLPPPILVRQYARGLPGELLEAARVDGAGELRIFVQIVLPLLKPILVTLAVFTFLTAWNDFMWPLIALTGQQHYTLPVGLASLSREHVQDSGLMMAGAVVTVIPVLVLFLALQRYYLRGLLLGSVKG